jgi:Aspartyl protease/PDZ domain
MFQLRPKLTGIAVFATVVAAATAGLQAEAAAAAETPFILASGKVHVPVRIGGIDTWFILDGGANVSILDRSLAEELGLELRGTSHHDGGAGSGGFTVSFTTVPSLAWAGIERTEVPMAVVERKTAAANGHESRGLLGADVFQQWVVEIDYRGRRLALHEPETFAYSGDGTALPITFDEASKCHLETWIALPGGEPIRADMIVDTGSRGFADFAAPFTAEHDLLAALDPKVLATVGWGVGGEVRHWIGRLGSLRTGPFEFPAVVATFAPPGTQGAYGRDDRSGILGAEWLSRFRVLFDYSRRQLVLEPSGDASPASRSDASGLFLASEPPSFESVRVLSVAEGSPAAAAGVEVGDVVLTLDGQAVSELGLDGLREELREAGRTVLLVIVRDGETRTVRIALRDLV